MNRDDQPIKKEWTLVESLRAYCGTTPAKQRKAADEIESLRAELDKWKSNYRTALDEWEKATKELERAARHCHYWRDLCEANSTDAQFDAWVCRIVEEGE